MARLLVHRFWVEAFFGSVESGAHDTKKAMDKVANKTCAADRVIRFFWILPDWNPSNHAKTAKKHFKTAIHFLTLVKVKRAN